MPHCILEYSSNIIDQVEPRKVLLELHDVLAGTGAFRREDIKGRAIRHQEFVVGDGTADAAFICLELAILEGRDDEMKTRIARDASAVLQAAFRQTLAQRRCSLTVRVTDMHRPSYQKVVTEPS